MVPVRQLLGGAFLVLALDGAVGADSPSVTSLLKPLGLVEYPARPTPPRFSGHTFDGRPVAMEELRGKAVLVNFWVSWCLECRLELPQLERLYQEFAPQGLAVVGVNAREDGERVRRYAKELRLTFPLVLDPDGRINAAYGVVGLPSTFVVGRDGRAVALGVGPREWVGASARALIQTLLAEPAPHAR